MRNSKFLFQIITLVFFISFSFTSCEVEEDSLIEEAIIDEEPILDKENLVDPSMVIKHIESSRKSLPNQNALRYFMGGSQSLHTYRLASSGVSIGAYEGISFSTPVISVGEGYDTNKYATLFFLIHPQNEDFVLTTTSGEYFNLVRSGWRSRTFGRPLIQKRAGNGKVPLYRFYRASNSDHLYTKSYAEGIRGGYTYEGITGYVN